MDFLYVTDSFPSFTEAKRSAEKIWEQPQSSHILHTSVQFSRCVSVTLSSRSTNDQPGRDKVGRWNEQSAPQAMCDAEKDWHESSFRASGAFGSRQNLPFNKPENSFSFSIFQPAVHYD